MYGISYEQPNITWHNTSETRGKTKKDLTEGVNTSSFNLITPISVANPFSLSVDYDERSGMVGGPVTSVDTVGVDPVVGGLVRMVNGAGVGGMVLQMSVYSQLPFKKDPPPKFWLQHLTTEL